MSSDLEDAFSEQSEPYVDYGPAYPIELTEYLSSIVDSHERAWNAGAGSGKLARQLAERFDEVIATGVTEALVKPAPSHPRVRYEGVQAGRVAVEDGSVDLIAAAQAAHWFDLPTFYSEVRRVCRSGAAIALISYKLPRIDPKIDPFVFGYANQIVGSYWSPRRAHVDAGYLTLPFPFEELTAPLFSMTEEWTVEEFISHLGSWPATLNYERTHGSDPRIGIRDELARQWGHGRRSVEWPIRMRLGRVDG
ncbi:MAG: class I SAM-dependent methyltransferase [Bacteroidota bacterium]